MDLKFGQLERTGPKIRIKIIYIFYSIRKNWESIIQVRSFKMSNMIHS
jgi:hypothetical protein